MGRGGDPGVWETSRSGTVAEGGKRILSLLCPAVPFWLGHLMEGDWRPKSDAKATLTWSLGLSLQPLSPDLWEGVGVVPEGVWNFSLGLAPEPCCWVPSTLETSVLRRAALLHLLGCSRGLSG